MSAAVSQSADWGDQSTWLWQGLHCHWRVLGPENGVAVLLLHGFGTSSAHWRRCAPRLAKAGFRVFAIDLIGFGASEQPGWSKRLRLDNRLWGRQVQAFLTDVVQRPAVLVGNSLGGLSALTAAVFDPRMIRAVVAAPLPDPALIQPIAKRRPPRRRALQRQLLSLVLRLLPLELIVPLISRTPLLKVGLQGAYLRSIADDRELLQLIARPARRPTAARALRAMSIGMAIRPRGATAPALLERLQGQVPTLLLWGRQDRFVPLAIGTQTAHRYPWLNLSVIEDSGHCPHDETPDLFLNELLCWLDLNLDKSSAAGEQQRR